VQNGATYAPGQTVIKEIPFLGTFWPKCDPEP